MKRWFWLMIAVMFVAAPLGCGDGMKYELTETSYLMNTDAFDLEATVALVKDGKVKDAAELEQQINAPESAINNVDLNGDGKIDFVGVQEQKTEKGYTLDFVAQPSENKEDHSTIASVNVSQTAKETVVEGGYPSYVEGHASHYYHHVHHGIGDLLFYSWLFSPMHVPYVMPFYGGVGFYYAPRPVLAMNVVSTQRSTYRTNRGVSSMKKTTAPKNFSSGIKSAQKTQAKISSPSKSNSPSGLKSYKVQSKTPTNTGGKSSTFGGSGAKKSTGSSTPKSSAPKVSKPSFGGRKR